MAIHIRAALAGDLTALGELARTTYVAAFGASFEDAEDLRQHLQTHLSQGALAAMLESDEFLLALDAEMPVGFLQYGIATDSQTDAIELRRLYVMPSHQNQRVGSCLMDVFLAHPDAQSSVMLDVWEHNHGARRFYSRYGFNVVGRQHFDVASGASTSDDLIMVRAERTPKVQ